MKHLIPVLLLIISTLNASEDINESSEVSIGYSGTTGSYDSSQFNADILLKSNLSSSLKNDLSYKHTLQKTNNSQQYSSFEIKDILKYYFNDTYGSYFKIKHKESELNGLKSQSIFAVGLLAVKDSFQYKIGISKTNSDFVGKPSNITSALELGLMYNKKVNSLSSFKVKVDLSYYQDKNYLYEVSGQYKSKISNTFSVIVKEDLSRDISLQTKYQMLNIKTSIGLMYEF